MKPPKRIYVAALALVAVSGACGIGRANRSESSMTLRVIEGEASIIRESKTLLVRSDVGVMNGDIVALDESSSAELTLARGRVLELAGARLEIKSPTSVRLERGDVLGQVKDRMSVDAETVSLTAFKGAFRVNRELATRIGVYEGSAVKLSGVAESLIVPKYRQAVVAGGVIPRAPKPLKLDPRDPWDRRLMQDALDLDTRLVNFARGLEAQLGEGTGVEFFQQVSPVGDVAFLSPFLSNRRSDLLIGLSFAAEAAKAGSQNPSQFFERMFGLWTEGATWGLIGKEFRVGQEGVFAQLLQAVQRVGLFEPGGLAPAFRRPRATRPRVAPTSSTRRPGTPGGGGPSPSPSRSTIPVVEEPVPTTGVPIVDDLFSPADEGVTGPDSSNLLL